MPDEPGFAPFPRDAPLPEEYGRVTNPERFVVLHDVVDRLVARLVADFDVVRDDDPPLPFPHAEVVRAVRLVPSNGGAPVTLVCTSFPGVKVAFGEAHTWGYPHCGCDACRDDPADLTAELETDVLAVVDGRFTEYRNRRGETGYRIDLPGGHKAGTPRGRLTERRWPPWSRR